MRRRAYGVLTETEEQREQVAFRCVRDEREQLRESDGDDLCAAVERVIVEGALVYVRVAARVAHQLQLEERGHLRESDTAAAALAAEGRAPVWRAGRAEAVRYRVGDAA